MVHNSFWKNGVAAFNFLFNIGKYTSISIRKQNMYRNGVEVPIPQICCIKYCRDIVEMQVEIPTFSKKFLKRNILDAF